MKSNSTERKDDAKGLEVKRKTTAVKSTRTANEAYKFIKEMYSRARQARDEGAPIAWVMTGSLVAAEVLRTMGVASVYPENYGAVCAAKRCAEPLLVKAEAEGYSNLICGYARAGLGHAIMRSELGMIPPDAPEGGLADPDVMIGGTSHCDPGFKWFQAASRYMNVPYHPVEILIPPIDADLKSAWPRYVRYGVEGLRGLVAFLERQLGRKLDYDKLQSTVDIAQKTLWTWWQCQELRKAVPCPMPSEDDFAIFPPAYYFLGEQQALDFYRGLYDELKYRVDNKIGVIPDEKFRLLWGGGLPPWHNMGMFNYFESLGAVFVTETHYNYGRAYQYDSPDDDPLERIVKYTLHRFVQWHEKAARGCGQPQVQRLLDLIQDYQIDGIVMHASVSCRFTTIGNMFYKDVLQNYLKIPTLFIESDIVDSRGYSESQFKERIDGFVDILAARKGKKAI